MSRRSAHVTRFKRTVAAIAVASCFAAHPALANPTGPTVVNGTAEIHRQGNLLQITNSPNAIINWQSFSVGASEITRFIQQSQSSAVLNRVTGAGGAIDPSVILGALQSNGRVLLINPSGILFGAGAQIDVAGLVASSLNLSNADFLANRLRFTEVPGAGSVINQGNITTGAGGNVYLVGPAVTNSGLITSPKGEVILAAGNSVELVNPGTPNLRVEITAPDNQAVNLGQIVADSGRVGIYAGLINHSGTIRADSAVVTDDGRIVLRATRNTTLEAGSVTTANGPSGGSITVQSGDTTLVAGTIEAKGLGSPPSQLISSPPSQGEGEGGGDVGKGGTVHILGDKVGLVGNASVNASGESGGGTVLVGGDFQGKNPDVQNAFRTFFGFDATIRADAVTSDDGGKVIVWADDVARAYGTISARGGAHSGSGGFIEVSSRNYLDFAASIDASAPKGRLGTLLLDPLNIVVATGGTATIADVATFAANPGTTQTISPATLNTAGATVVLQATNDITVQSSVNLTTAGAGFVAQAGNDINVNANLTTNVGRIVLEADSPHAPGGANGIGRVNINADVNSNGGPITLIGGGNANPVGGFSLNANVNAGAGGINVALSQNTAQLPFFIGAGGNTQLSSNDTGYLNTTGPLVLGTAITAGDNGLGLNAQTLIVNSITNNNAAPIQLSSASGSSFQLVAGSGGILLGRPLTTFQDTSITTTGAVTVNDTLATSNHNLTITATNFTLGSSGSINTGSGAFVCTVPGCPAINTVFWTGSAGLTPGDGVSWFDPLNWSTDTVPTALQDVTIGGAFGTILVSGAAMAKSLIAGSPLQLSSGSLTLTNASNFSDAFTLSGGNLLGTGGVTVSGASGALTWSGGSMGSGGTFLLASGRSGTLSGTLSLNRLFENAGTLTLSNTTVNNGGTGSISNLIGGTISTAASSSNAFNVALTNAGNLNVGSGTVLSSTSSSLTNLTGGVITAGGTLSLGSGTFNNSGSATINGAASVGTLALSGGTVNGAGNLTVTADYNQTGGTLGTTFANLSLTKSGNFSVGGFTATNSASLTATGGALTDGNGSGIVNVTAPGVSLTAANGIDLDTAASTLTGSNTSSGNTAIRNTGAVTVGASGVSNSGGGSVLLTSTGRITLNGTVTAGGGTGDAIVLAGTGFTNNAGSSALNPGSGRWLVYSGDPTAVGESRGGLVYNFKQYNATYGVAPVAGAGNGFLYSVAPTVAPSLTGATTKAYDRTTTASLSVANYATTVAIDGDTVVLNNPASGSYADKNAGTGKSVSTTVAIASAANGAASVFGYQLSSTTASGNIGTITPATLLVNAVTANNKVYDATAVATLTTGSAALGGVIAGDTVTLNGAAATGSFNNKNVGVAKPVTAAGFVLGGGDAGNYALTQPTGLTADITLATLLVNAVTANNKVYDATTVATLTTGSAALGGVIAGDTVTLNGAAATGSFNTKDVGTAKPVTGAGFAIGGADAANYTLAQPTGLTANITPAALPVNGVTANSKVYDATTAAALNTGSASVTPLGSDVVALSSAAATGSFNNKNVGVAKPVTAAGFVLGGGDAGNYALTQPTGLTADITPATLAYLANAASRERGDPNPVFGGAVSGFVGGETLITATTGTPSFTSPATQSSVEGQYAINGSGLTALNGNYTFMQAPANTTALTVTAPVNFSWTSNTGGAWESGSNWNKGFAPVADAVVTIPDLPGSATITYSSGTTSVKMVTSFEGLTIAGGTLNLGASAADVSTFYLGAPLKLTGGTLGGAGTIIGNVNNVAGTVAPGMSAGVLTINGNYMQGSGGTLAVELGGRAAGTQYDQLVVTGNSTLGGTLSATLVNGFVPANGEAFMVVQSGGTVNGTFAATNLPSTPSFSTNYLVSSVNVTTGGALVPPVAVVETTTQAVVAATDQSTTSLATTAPPPDEKKNKEKSVQKKKPMCTGSSSGGGSGGTAAPVMTGGGGRCTTRGCF